MSERNDKVIEQRRRYIAGELTHAEYYTWLGEFIGLRPGHLHIPLDEIRASMDEHLNDILLNRWDNHNDSMRRLASGIS